MRWFGAKAILRATHSNLPASEDLFEEIVFVIRADDEQAALEKTRRLAEAETPEYKNVYGAVVTWRVDQILEPCEVDSDEVRDGSQVYSRFYYLREGQEVSPRELTD